MSADPLAEVVALLQPRALLAKLASGAGRWQVRRSEPGRPFYGAVLEGRCRLAVAGEAPLLLDAGDFVLIPAAFEFSVSSPELPRAATAHQSRDGETRHGRLTGPPDVRMVIGYCTFASPDASLLVSLLPRLIVVRGVARLSALVQLVADETRAQRPARAVVLERLLEVLLIEALRNATSASTNAQPGLVHGLADEQLAIAIRRMHEQPSRGWTVAQLAKAAALSRSAFFDRFTRAVGVAPMTYLLGWRMALAKALLARAPISVGEVARRVGYSSASTFSVAFTRHVGEPPTAFAKKQTPEPLPTRASKLRAARAQYAGS